MPKINPETRRENIEHLVKTAESLFIERGYNKTSVNDIVKVAKVSKGGFYTYFESKEALFFEMIHNADQSIIHYGSLLKKENKGDWMKNYIEYRLRRYFNEENRMRAKYTFEFWTSTTLTKNQMKDLEKRYQEFKEDIKSILEISHSHKIKQDDVKLETFIDLMIATIDGLIFTDVVLNRTLNENKIDMLIDLFSMYLS
ncbi:MAG: TetR/AcrR family transcriptional regulator [Clostridia bacterium]|nr:TetR/AcrR family transcriptional regulator [Clostridia bacterium]